MGGGKGLLGIGMEKEVSSIGRGIEGYREGQRGHQEGEEGIWNGEGKKGVRIYCTLNPSRNKTTFKEY